MIVERFSEGKTLLHTLDPRFKICIAFPYAFMIALSDRLIVAGVSLIVAVLLLLIAHISFVMVAKSLKVLALFLVLLWIFLPLSIPGITIFTIGPVSWSFEGVIRTLSITLKSTSIVLLVIALLGTSSVFTLVHALSHFHVPKKFLYLTFLSYRYIQVIYVEYLRLRDAIRIRGFKPGTNLHTYKTYGYLIGMLLIRSYERSERIYKSMLCRGFQGRFYLLDHFRYKRKDIIFLFVMASILIGSGLLAWM